MRGKNSYQLFDGTYNRNSKRRSKVAFAFPQPCSKCTRDVLLAYNQSILVFLGNKFEHKTALDQKKRAKKSVNLIKGGSMRQAVLALLNALRSNKY